MFGISGIKNMNIISNSTGESLGNINDEIRQLDFIGESNISPLMSANTKQEFSFEATGKLDDDLIRLLTRNPKETECKFDLEFIGEVKKLVQKRIHRKKRINKKWAKKYGYNEVLTKCNINIPFKNLEITPNEDGTCEVSGDLCV